jgi:hypothetical protein
MLVTWMALAAAEPPTSAAHGPWTVSWTPADVTVTAPGMDPQRLDGDFTEENYQDDAAVIAVVGPWVTVSHSWYGEGGAHPTYGTTWRVHDLTRRGEPAHLTDLFPEEDLLAALAQDDVVRRMLGDHVPTSVGDLLASADGGCEFHVPSLTESWAFHHVKRDKVAVRIGLPYGCEVMRGTFTQIGIYLPIPPLLRPLLREADERGTLMEDLVAPGAN